MSVYFLGNRIIMKNHIGYWLFSTHSISGKIIFLELYLRIFLFNQSTGFFKLQYLKKEQTDCVTVLHAVRDP